MFESFNLVTIVKRGSNSQILKIDLEQNSQKKLSEDWEVQYKVFQEYEQVPFTQGYSSTPDQEICFFLKEFDLPSWLDMKGSIPLTGLDRVNDHEKIVDSIAGFVAYVSCSDGMDRILFQNFTKGKIIKPGRMIFMKGNTYNTLDNDGLWLDNKLSAVYECQSRKLLFKNFVTANKIIGLYEVYRDATNQDIQEILRHKLFYPGNVEKIIKSSDSQWHRKRFAMLKDSKILDEYSADDIKNSAARIDIEVELKDNKIMFPEEPSESKKFLQLLNEELFKGVITDTIYETNSKKPADN